MKRYLKYISLFCFIILVFGCKEETIGQYPIDTTAPAPVENVTVENLPGSVRITYEIPDEEDLLYVKAKYPQSNGKDGVVKASIFSNTLVLKGFGKSRKHTIQLFTVDRSQNVSSPVLVEIEPLDSPIYEILDGINVDVSFGGFKLNWTNPLKEEIIVEVLQRGINEQEFSHIENIYSSAETINTAVRGLDSTYATFGIFVRDIYNNHTDTLKVNLKPYFEEELPKSEFKAMPLYSKFNLHNYGGYGGLVKMWDEIYNVPSNLLYIKIGNEIMPFFTMDLGVKAKLSRFRLWQRSDFLFDLHNPKMFEWYGTNDESLAIDNQTLDWEYKSGCVKLGDFESRRPSGLGGEDPLTVEDEEYALAGEEFEFELDIESVRYLRFKLNKTWSNSDGLIINELTFWGEIQ